jgi:hypothetical protein
LGTLHVLPYISPLKWALFIWGIEETESQRKQVTCPRWPIQKVQSSSTVCAPGLLLTAFLAHSALCAIHLTHDSQASIESLRFTKHSRILSRIKLNSLPTRNLKFGYKGHYYKKRTDNPSHCQVSPTQVPTQEGSQGCEAVRESFTEEAGTPDGPWRMEVL